VEIVIEAPFNSGPEFSGEIVPTLEVSIIEDAEGQLSDPSIIEYTSPVA